MKTIRVAPFSASDTFIKLEVPADEVRAAVQKLRATEGLMTSAGTLAGRSIFEGGAVAGHKDLVTWSRVYGTPRGPVLHITAIVRNGAPGLRRLLNFLESSLPKGG